MRVIIETTEEVKHVFCGEHNIHKKRLEEILAFRSIFKWKQKDKAILSYPATTLVRQK